MGVRLPARDGYDRFVEELDGACAFCTMTSNLDIRKFAAWTWVYAAFPYRRFHTLLVPTRHVERLSELTPDEMAGLQEAQAYAEDAYASAGIVGDEGIEGGHLLSFWRYRVAHDPMKQSVRHLHLHICPFPTGAEDVQAQEDPERFDLGLLR